MCGRRAVGKSFLRVLLLGRCGHVFDLLVRHIGPLAIMPSAERVPTNCTRFEALWRKWVFPLSVSTGVSITPRLPFPNLYSNGPRSPRSYGVAVTGSR